MTERVPCVAAILYNAEAKVLLQQRDDKSKLRFAGYWTLFGGKVEADESVHEAIKRELLEEIELEANLNHWKVYDRWHNDTIIVEQHIFIGEIQQAAEEIILNEGQALGFFCAGDLPSLKIAFGFEVILAEFFDRSAE